MPSKFLQVLDAFNSLLRTDYISLNDVEKLGSLAEYYVDYFGYLPQILTESDQLIVGRRGTGKTTLFYRAFVECTRSWRNAPECFAKPRTLGIYVDLNKSQPLDDELSFEQLEHIFVGEICDAITNQMARLWPELNKEPNLFSRLFRATELKNVLEVKNLLARFAELLRNGIPRLVDHSEPVQIKESQTVSTSQTTGAQGTVNISSPSVQANLSQTITEMNTSEHETSTKTVYRLMISDILKLLDELKEKAGLSAIFLFIDEYSALSDSFQGRFTTLLRKMLGTHAGVFIKLGAITDKYTLGSSIILQRDLFELSLDLDAYVERSGHLKEAMDGLREQVEAIVTARLKAYKCPPLNEIFNLKYDWMWVALSRSAMGVPRTLGTVLKQAWSRAQNSTAKRIRQGDISFGIQYASKAYIDQMLGAAKGGIAIPAVIAEIWDALIMRAQEERDLTRTSEASHFMVVPRLEYILKYLNMFFVVHLLSAGSTSKKQRTSRSMYCFDFGICEENRLGFSTDRDMFRQQRFVYDDVLSPFEKFFNSPTERTYRCPVQGCGRTFKESELKIKGEFLNYCPAHRVDLIVDDLLIPITNQDFTEEEIKIIGAIRSATKADQKFAQQIADDVGCHRQKVSKFAEKLERDKLIQREKISDKYIYFGK